MMIAYLINKTLELSARVIKVLYGVKGKLLLQFLVIKYVQDHCAASTTSSYSLK